MLVSATAHLEALHSEGFGDFASFNRSFAASSLLLGESASFEAGVPAKSWFRKVPTWVNSVLGQESNQPRLGEHGGRAFFLSHPAVYARLAKAVLDVIPEGFRKELERVADLKAAKAWARAMLEEEDFGESSFTLWGGGGSYVYVLHVDYVLANLLTHLVGAKRVWLYPPDDHELLYLEGPEGGFGTEAVNNNWEEVSQVSFVPSELYYGHGRLPKKFELLRHATPLAVDLSPGDSLLIPCGWAHVVEYSEPALSVGTTLAPDWFQELPDGWAPKGCSDYYAPSPQRQDAGGAWSWLASWWRGGAEL